MKRHILLLVLSLALLPALARAQGQAADSPVEKPAAEAEALGERQLSLMEARILSRQGDVPKSLSIYARLRAEYPQDQEVYEDYLETLVAVEMYERALYELPRFRKLFGSTSRSERIEAGLYAELQRPRYGLDILERAMRGNPDDTGLWADLGTQRQASRDVGGAIQAYSEVLEKDPGNQAVKEALHGLLLENRPRTEFSFSSYDQGRNAVTNTYSTVWSMAVAEGTRLFAEYDQVHVSRPADENGVTSDLGVAGARVEHQLTSRLTVEGGLKTYLGVGDGLSPMAGAKYAMGDFGSAAVNYAYHLPWYDQAEAADLSGSEDRLRVSWEMPFRQVWTFYAGLERLDYRLGDRDFGERWEGTGSVARQIWRNPDISLIYTFQRAEFQYGDNDYRPIDMVRRESSHMGTVTIAKNLAPWLEAALSAGIKHDLERSKESLMLSPRLTFHPLERLRFSLGWDYASESDTVAGGESNTFTARAAWTW